MNLDFKMKRFFFDRAVVVNHFGAKGERTLKALSRFGAYLRRVARNSLKRTSDPRKSAPPGRPPLVHTADDTITLKNIQFAYDFSTSSMVVGSVLTNNSKRKGPQAVPDLLEHGGTIAIRGETRLIAPHPWMAPALDRTRDRIPEAWATSLSS